MMMRSERGAAAVEFAFVLIPLLVLVLGMLEFSRVYNTQLSLSNAAREAARYAAIHWQDASVEADAQDRAVITAVVNPALATGDVDIAIPCAGIAGEGLVTAEINYSLDGVTGFFLPEFNLYAKGAMVCGG